MSAMAFSRGACHHVYNDVGIVKADGGVDAPKMRHFALMETFRTRGSSPNLRAKTSFATHLFDPTAMIYIRTPAACGRQAAHSSGRSMPHHVMTRARLRH